MRFALNLAIAMALTGCQKADAPSTPGAASPAPTATATPPAAAAAATPPAAPHEPAGHGEHEGHGEHAAPSAQGPRPLRVMEDGARVFGAEPSGDRPLTPLAEIVAHPANHDGQLVRTEGTVEQVCERKGCWMELRDGGETPVRITFVGYSFFVPADIKGHRATLEGRVNVRPLSDADREHLAGEGANAGALAQATSIVANSVVVR